MNTKNENEFDDGPNEEFDTDLGFDDTANAGTNRNAALMKIGLVAAAFVVVIVGISMFGGGGGTPTPPSQVSTGTTAVAGGTSGVVDPKYEEAVANYNQEKFNQAKETGASVIPIGITPNDDSLTTQGTAQAPMTPTERQRQIQEQARREQDIRNAQLIEQQNAAQAQARAQAVQSMSQAMSSYLTSAVANRQPSGMSEMSIGYQTASVTGGGDGSGTGGASGGASTAVATPNTILPAATIEYGQLMIEANTDAPGPVLAMVVSGKLAGARLLGSFQKTDEYLTLNFNQAVTKSGKSIPIQAIALDPDSTLPGMVTEIDRKYFQRYILPAAADFISGVGEAIAEVQVDVNQTDTSTTTSADDPDFDEAVAQGISDAFDGIADAVKDAGRSTQPMLRIAAGTPIGILFTQEVLDQTNAEAAAAAAAQNNQNQEGILGAAVQNVLPYVYAPPGYFPVQGAPAQQSANP